MPPRTTPRKRTRTPTVTAPTHALPMPPTVSQAVADRRPNEPRLDAESATKDSTTSQSASVSRVTTRASKRHKSNPTKPEEPHQQQVNGEGEEDCVSDVTANVSSPSITATVSAVAISRSSVPLIPHGILKLPQSIASALASDFLSHREIRDLGVTCRWMLVSLNQCEIKVELLLKHAFHRLARQKLAFGSEPTSARNQQFRQLVSKLPNLWIGKFRSFDCRGGKAALSFLHDLSQLIDARSLVFRLSQCTHKCPPHIKNSLLAHPLNLPPNLQDFIIQDFDFFSLSNFVLPSSIRRIHLPYAASNSVLNVTFPTDDSSHLKELLNVSAKQPIDGVILPASLLRLTFASPFDPPITNLVLPNLITDLTIHRWMTPGEDGQVCYRDLPFPQHLKRLVFTADIESGDFNLAQWKHLPTTCINLGLTLITEHRLHTFIVKSIVLTPFIQQARIRRNVNFRAGDRYPLIPLDLTHASSLTSLIADNIHNINWPTSSILHRIEFSSHTTHDAFRLPSIIPPMPSVRELVFEDQVRWRKEISPYELDAWHQSFPNLTSFHAPLNVHPAPASLVRELLIQWSHALIDCIVVSPLFLRPTGQSSCSDGVWDLEEYKNGELHSTIELRQPLVGEYITKRTLAGDSSRDQKLD